MEKVKIYNLIILDESGSMGVIKSATIQGFNEVVQTIKGTEQQFPEQEHYVSLTFFNSVGGIRTKLDRQKASELLEISEETFQPNSQTPLYDAIGYSIVKLRNDIKTEKSPKVLVTIITDGEENASREYSSKQLAQIIKDLKRDGWTFTYIGANHNVKEASEKISIEHHLSFQATEEDVRNMFLYERNARSVFYRGIRNGNTSRDFFTDETADAEEKSHSDTAILIETKKETLLEKLVRHFKKP